MYFIIYIQSDNCHKVLPRFRHFQVFLSLFQPRTYFYDHAVPVCVVVVVVFFLVLFFRTGKPMDCHGKRDGLFLTKLGRNISARATGEIRNWLVFIWGQHTVSE